MTPLRAQAVAIAVSAQPLCLRLAARRRSARPGAFGARAAGALRRPPRAHHRRRRLDRPRARDAAARVPSRADHAARRARVLADRRPARAATPMRSSESRTRSATCAIAGRLRGRDGAGAAGRDLPPRRLQARRLGRGLPGGVRRHEPARQLERAARGRRRGVETVVVASTDKAALAASFYGRTKRFMEQLTAFSARRAGAQRIAVRFVNVLGSAGSASELFLRQARANVPLTVTDPGMVRYWVTMAHAATLAAHAALLAAEGAHLAGPADPVELSVGELAERIWRRRGPRRRSRARPGRHPPRRDAERDAHRPGRSSWAPSATRASPRSRARSRPPARPGSPSACPSAAAARRRAPSGSRRCSGPACSRRPAPIAL